MKRRRNKKVALSLLILLIVGIASYYLSKTKTDSPILTTTHTSTTTPYLVYQSIC